jgi:small subunit ribosomal protein S6
LKTFAPKLYEAMFLVDSAKAAADWDGIQASITSLLGKSDAEILSMKKWDERRLAYDISRQSRGTYILCYFKGDGQKIGDLERNVQLSEEILRVLVLRGDHVKPEDLEKDTPATRVEKSRQAAEDAAKAKEEPKAKDAVVSEESAEAKVEPDEAVVATEAEESAEPEQIAPSEEESPSVELSEEPPAQVDTEVLAESTEEAEADEDEVPDIFAMEPELNESEETEKTSE